MISTLAIRLLEVGDGDFVLAVAGPAGNCHFVVVADRVVHVHEYIILSLVSCWLVCQFPDPCSVLKQDDISWVIAAINVDVVA